MGTKLWESNPRLWTLKAGSLPTAPIGRRRILTRVGGSMLENGIKRKNPLRIQVVCNLRLLLTALLRSGLRGVSKNVCLVIISRWEN
ncbi:jg27140 [Pararge aegeria aegeria]|uniref:Jg27140 protein n=1 Tax=Pararge aegeria aegeria TaxID=348720 RepID=A0A8S4QU44_9NEOP|nr:jg27140 [Pararge aegeria aegeria]